MCMLSPELMSPELTAGAAAGDRTLSRLMLTAAAAPCALFAAILERTDGSGDQLSVERGVKRGRAGERDGDRPSRGSRPWRSVESRAPAALILTHQHPLIVNIFGIICV